MAFKPVGVDELGSFPPRVMTYLATQFAAPGSVGGGAVDPEDIRNVVVDMSRGDGTSIEVTYDPLTKLLVWSTDATQNSTDDYLLNRSHHTGTQTADTISDFATAVAAVAPTSGGGGSAQEDPDNPGTYFVSDAPSTGGTGDGTATQGPVTIANLPAGVCLLVKKTGSTWPARPTARTDISVIAMGAAPDPSWLTPIDLRWVV